MAVDGAYRIAILDDDQSALETLRSAIERYGHRHALDLTIHSFTNTLDIEEAIEEASYDLYFLEILVGNGEGIGVAHRIRKDDQLSHIIFVTESDEHYKEAYRLQVTQYLLKPFDENHLVRCLDSILPRSKKYLNIADGNKVLRLPIDRIYYCTSEDHYKRIVCDGGSRSVRATMSQILSSLNDERFFRLSNRIVVNLDYVTETSPDHVLMENGQRFKMPRGKYKIISAEMLKRYF